MSTKVAHLISSSVKNMYEPAGILSQGKNPEQSTEVFFYN